MHQPAPRTWNRAGVSLLFTKPPAQVTALSSASQPSHGACHRVPARASRHHAPQGLKFQQHALWRFSVLGRHVQRKRNHFHGLDVAWISTGTDATGSPGASSRVCTNAAGALPPPGSPLGPPPNIPLQGSARHPVTGFPRARADHCVHHSTQFAPAHLSTPLHCMPGRPRTPASGSRPACKSHPSQLRDLRQDTEPLVT